MQNIPLTSKNVEVEIPKLGMPVSIITGFLGSGKTTLLNQILQNKQDLKIAVLVNEFGDIDIDSQLLVTVEQDMLELTNGCICCTINDGLVDVVYRILEREQLVDYLVIETTGVADPLPIILTFLGTELRDLTNLDSIITVVDAETFDENHFNSEAALQQITYGDFILLNKIDLVNVSKLEEIKDFISKVKQGSRILPTQQCQVPLELLLGVNLMPRDKYISDNYQNSREHKHHHHDHEHHSHSHHLENDGFVSIAFRSDKPFDVNRFEDFLAEAMPQDVFRAKGILWFSDSDMRHIFQLSGPRYTLNANDWRTLPKNELVFIGRKLDQTEIVTKLSHCLL